MFLNLKGKLEKGNIINIPKTNITYIEPHKLVINNITYLFFNEYKNVSIYTNITKFTLETSNLSFVLLIY